MVLVTLTFVSMGMAIAIPEEEHCYLACHNTFERDIPLTHWCLQSSPVRSRWRCSACSRWNERSLLINGVYSVAYWFLEQMVKQVQIVRGTPDTAQTLFIDRFWLPFFPRVTIRSWLPFYESLPFSLLLDTRLSPAAENTYKDVDTWCTPRLTFHSDLWPVLPGLPETTSNEHVTGSPCLLSSVVDRIFISFHFHMFEGASEYWLGSTLAILCARIGRSRTAWWRGREHKGQRTQYAGVHTYIYIVPGSGDPVARASTASFPHHRLNRRCRYIVYARWS